MSTISNPSTHTPAPSEASAEIDGYVGLPLGSRIANLFAILLPLVGLVVGIVYFWGNGVSWPQLALMTVMYIVTGMGITVGYHRLFTHKSFSAGPIVTMVIGIIGSMAADWVTPRRCRAKCSPTWTAKTTTTNSARITNDIGPTS